ncbi:MAG: PAS domain S-box protein [Candidatus Omnitrophica bacterium]|nr:PAS domain S-box protein [Candidatus Omnitrophota bacterium]
MKLAHKISVSLLAMSLFCVVITAGTLYFLAKDAFASLPQYRSIFLFVVAMVMVAAWVLGQLMSRHIADPFQKLHEVTQTIVSVDQEHPKTDPVLSEADQMARAYEIMAANLEKASSTVTRLHKEIDEREKLEQSLQVSEGRFRDLFDRAPQGITISTVQGDLVKVNDAFAAMHGYTIDEILRAENLEVMHATFKQEREDIVFRIIDGEVVHYEMEHYHKNGTVFPLSVTANVIESGGQPLIMSFFQDISARKQAEEALRQSEERTRSITDSAKDAILMVDANGAVNFWNPAAERIFGYTAEESIGSDLLDLIVPEHCRQDYINAVAKVLKKTDGPVTAESAQFTARRKDGTEFPVSFSLSSVKRKGGWNIAGIFSDVSERMKAQENLLMLTRAIEQSPATVVITNLKGDIEYVNPHFTALTGYTLDEARGQNPRILKTGDLSPEVYKNLWATITRGDEWSGEFQNKKKSGEFFWEKALISPIRDTTGKITHYLAVKEDITELKKAEAEMNALKLQLVQSDKLATLGEMATGLAHEINQPLGGISLVTTSFRKFMEKKILTEDKLAAGIKDIETSIKRMTKTINHIRIYARQETLEFTDIDLPETIDSALTLLGEQLRIHGIELDKTIEPDLPRISGEAHQLEQVWINLMSNARDAMDEKEKKIAAGELVITGYHKTLMITATYQRSMNMLSVTFADNGIGMSEAQSKKIFQPFFTTKEVGKGTGLGLSISQGIIQRHNGKIEISSKPGEGTAFNILLAVAGIA